MKYQPMFNIWEVPTVLYKHIKRGQWVYAGDKDNKGIFIGVKKSGVVVVAWYHNAKRNDYRDYVQNLTNYCKG